MELHRFQKKTQQFYLMDNLEVWKGLYELELAGLEDTQAISEIRKKIQKQIEKIFWDDANQRWRIIGNSDRYHQTEFIRMVLLRFIR